MLAAMLPSMLASIDVFQQKRSAHWSSFGCMLDEVHDHMCDNTTVIDREDLIGFVRILLPKDLE